jgi:hypothetical protein
MPQAGGGERAVDLLEHVTPEQDMRRLLATLTVRSSPTAHARQGRQNRRWRLAQPVQRKEDVLADGFPFGQRERCRFVDRGQSVEPQTALRASQGARRAGIEPLQVRQRQVRASRSRHELLGLHRGQPAVQQAIARGPERRKQRLHAAVQGVFLSEGVAPDQPGLARPVAHEQHRSPGGIESGDSAVGTFRRTPFAQARAVQTHELQPSVTGEGHLTAVG